ncbi:LHFPL tetraspan subfamily member 7 protein-like [Lethenteron reissneri]|uniref:LHFPL tetraspan subfamily member 7 protein-like n=1 Tax=Lethenteron reissneri TaxID=7753 RepID=UPI002AB669BF|nr:LHFPL tetraspan subfamily member 7 protein-like [Lethenteron reissneri]
MLTCVACFWCLLSLALLAACSLGLVSPAWLARTAASAASGGGSGGVAGVGGAGMVSLGLFGYCGGGPTPGSVPLGGPAGGGGSGPGQVATHACSTYGGRGRFGDIPSAAWQVSVVLCGGGCSLLAVSSLLAVLCLVLPEGEGERRACTLAGCAQSAAVIIMGAGLLVFPLGLGSPFARQQCGDSAPFWAGDCQLAWGYTLAIVGVLLAAFLPYFARYVPRDPSPYPTPIPTSL